jgi:hypothetical protein
VSGRLLSPRRSNTIRSARRRVENEREEG